MNRIQRVLRGRRYRHLVSRGVFAQPRPVSDLRAPVACRRQRTKFAWPPSVIRTLEGLRLPWSVQRRVQHERWAQPGNASQRRISPPHTGRCESV